MKTVPSGDVTECPGCQTSEPQISAVVNVGRLERHFYECPACELEFHGSWLSADEPRVAAPVASSVPSPAA